SPASPTPAASRQQLSEMQRLLMPQLLNLFAAAESIRQQNRHRPSRLHRRHQSVVGNCLRDFELLRLESERPSHPAAPCLDLLHVRAGLSQQRNLIRRPAEYRFVMTVPVYKDVRPFYPPGQPIRRIRRQPVRQQPNLRAEFSRPLVLREEFQELILEYARATRLKKHERHTRVDSRSHAVEHTREVSTSMIEKPKIVERPPTADVLRRGVHNNADVAEHLLSGQKCLRVVVVVPRIRPQQHSRTWLRRRF